MVKQKVLPCAATTGPSRPSQGQPAIHMQHLAGGRSRQGAEEKGDQAGHLLATPERRIGISALIASQASALSEEWAAILLGISPARPH